MSSNWDQLPCGTELTALLEQIADDQPPANPGHQQTCPYCQAAISRLREGWQDVRLLARQPVAVPEMVTARIMARVRALAAQAASSIVLGQGRGITRISDAALARGMQRIVARVPGVAFASVKVDSHDPPHPVRVDVAIRLVITFGPAVRTVATAVRETLDRRVARLFAAEVGRIDITIADVTAPAAVKSSRLVRRSAGRG